MVFTRLQASSKGLSLLSLRRIFTTEEECFATAFPCFSRASSTLSLPIRCADLISATISVREKWEGKAGIE
jgi:hypothetical protein